MDKYKPFNLKDNPFKDVTPILSVGTETAWAGLPELKEKIGKVYKDTISSFTRQIVLNWGPWGGGKTFSAIYFTNRNPSSKTVKVAQAYIQCPKEGNQSTSEFFRSVIDAISYSNIQRQIQLVINSLGSDELFTLINNRIRSEEFSKAILKIGDDDAEIRDMMHTYIYSGLTKTDLKRVGLPRGIQSDKDRIKILSGILMCFIGNQRNLNGRFILWVDEMEDLIYFSQKNYRAFSQVLRDFSDLLSEGFTLFFNFTLSEPDESTIEMLLGSPLWSRINKKIRYKELTEATALKYVNDLLEEQKINQKSFFSDDIIKQLLETIPEAEMTPREINKRFSAFLEYCIDNDVKTISIASVNRFLESISEDD